MRADLSKLEPVPRDPKKLRRTALILVVLMIVGGFLVLFAYNRFSKNQWLDSRPAYAENRLTLEKDLKIIRQDGSLADRAGDQGKVCVIQVVSATQPETCALPVNVMKRLSARYLKNQDVVLISLVVDPGGAENVKSTLGKLADNFGASLPQWWVATNQPNILHRWVKKELHANQFPYQNATGQWKYDSSIVLVDRNRHIRKAVVPQKNGGPPYVTGFDFAQAADWDAQGLKTKTDFTNVEEMEFLLIRTIDHLLTEPVK